MISRRRSDHHGKNLPQLAQPAAGKKRDQIRIALRLNPACLQMLDHRMADKDRPQTGLVVEFCLERKNAEHQVESFAIFGMRRRFHAQTCGLM